LDIIDFQLFHDWCFCSRIIMTFSKIGLSRRWLTKIGWKIYVIDRTTFHLESWWSINLYRSLNINQCHIWSEVLTNNLPIWIIWQRPFGINYSLCFAINFLFFCKFIIIMIDNLRIITINMSTEPSLIMSNFAKLSRVVHFNMGLEWLSLSCIESVDHVLVSLFQLLSFFCKLKAHS